MIDRISRLAKQLCVVLIIIINIVEAQLPEHLITARSQIGVTTHYDPAYTKLAYPNGDVALEKGVCTDVIIRAYRQAYQFDFQEEIHEDMRNNFTKYPKIWGLKKTDRNIDHRRVPNIEVFLKRFAKSLPVTNNPEEYLPGDIVTQRLNNTLPHIMIISDKKTDQGVPLVIHNIGAGVKEEDQLFLQPIYSHFRFEPK